MFYRNFLQLCEQKGVSRGAVCQAVGLSNNAWRRWSTGSMPNGKSIKAIADFFGVEPKTMLKDADDSSAARQEAFDRPELRILFDAADGAPSKAILEASIMLMKAKESNQD